MTTLTLERPSMTVGTPSLFDDPGDRFTLEALVSRAWEDLSAEVATACPVCGGTLEPQFSTGPDDVSGRCSDCHSSLS